MPPLHLFFIAIFACIFCLVASDDSPVFKQQLELDMRNVGETKDFWVNPTKNGYHLRYKATPVPSKNLDFVGRGYDPQVGNPQEASVGGDKGYKQPVFEVNTSDDEQTSDGVFVKPRKVDLLVKLACQTDVSLKELSSKESLMSDSSQSVSEYKGFSAEISVGADIGGNLGYSTTDSESVRKMMGTLEDRTKTIVKSTAECSVYEETISFFNPPDFHPDFKTILDRLPRTYDGESKKYYHRIFQTYGTHVVMWVLMGSRYGKFYTIDRTTLEQISADEKSSESTTDFSVSAGGAGIVGGFEVSRSNSHTSSKEKENAIGSVAEDTSVFSIGADYNEDPVAWAQESATEPFPLRLKVMPLVLIIRKHYSEEIATNMEHALIDFYTETGGEHSTGFSKCYMATSQNVVYNKRNKRTTLIARCDPGYTAMGGSFTHLWNHNGDVVVDELTTASEKMLQDLKKYHQVRTQEQAVNYLLEKGSDMLKQFVDASTMDNLKKLFGNRVDPKNLKYFLSGKLDDLNLEKKDIAGSIASGLKLFGNNAIGNLANNFLKKSPLASSIMKVKDSFVKDVAESRTLDVMSDIPIPSETQLQKTYDHADALIEIINTLSKDKSSKPLIATDEAEALNFLSNLAKSVSNMAQDINDQISKVTQPIHQFASVALNEWKKFSGSLEDVLHNFSGVIKGSEQRIQSSSLYLDTVKTVRATSDPHGRTLLAARNSLNWLFPFKKDSWMCGGGSMGFEATSHSGMGICTAYCCSDHTWDVDTKMTTLRDVDMEKKTSESVAMCPLGSTAISGGILISDHQEGRFVQVVTSRPEGNDGWKCVVKWSEESFNAISPKFQCYVKCVVGDIAASCSTESETLINGHGTARCQPHQMAISGGWEVQSAGISYFKKSEFRNVHPIQGPLGYRCEFGTSHTPLTGSCFVRCCNVKTQGVLEAIEKDESCPPYWQRNKILQIGDLWEMRSWGRDIEDLGSVLKYGEEMRPWQFMVSRNGKYFMRFDPHVGVLHLYEDFECDTPHQIGHIALDPHHRCKNTRAEKFMREVVVRLHENFKKEEEMRRRYPHLNIFGRSPFISPAMMWFMGKHNPWIHSKIPLPSPLEQVRDILARFDVHQDHVWEFVKHSHYLREFVNLSGGLTGLMNRYAGNNQPHEPVLRVTQNGLEMYFEDTGDVCATAEYSQSEVETMQLFDNGDLNFLDDEKQSLQLITFDECRLYYRRHKFEKSQLKNGEAIFLNGGIISPNKQYALWFMPGGALSVIHQIKSDEYCKHPHLVWTTAKDRHTGDVLKHFSELAEFNRDSREGWVVRLQEDNNLVLFDDLGRGMWSSDTSGRGVGKATLEISNNGQIRLMDSVGVDLWTPHKGPVKSCVTLRERLKVRSHRLGAGSSLKPGFGGLVSKNAQYILFIEHDSATSQNNLELWREGGDDCKPARVITLKKNVNELAITPEGLMNGDQVLFKLEGDMPINEVTLENSAELWIHGGHNNRREISKQWHFMPGDPRQLKA